MSDQRILDEFVRVGGLLEGHFLLSSGLHSPRYLQCARVLQHPELAEWMCRELADRLGDVGAETVIGPAMGGIVVAYELARAMGTRGIFTERSDGRMQLRRGFDLRPGERVVLAEDVVTTGGSLMEVLKVVRDAGAEPVAVATLVDRSGDRKPDFGVPLAGLVRVDVPTYDPADCPLCAKGVELVKPGSRTPA